MKLVSLIVMFISAIVSVSAGVPLRMVRSFGDFQGDRSGLYNAEYKDIPEPLPPRRVRFYRTGGTILLG